MPPLIRARDTFLRIRKKIGLIMNLDATRQTPLAIPNSGKEDALTSTKKTPSQKGNEKGVRTPSLIVEVPPNPKRRGNPSPHEKPEVSLRCLYSKRF